MLAGEIGGSNVDLRHIQSHKQDAFLAQIIAPDNMYFFDAENGK